MINVSAGWEEKASKNRSSERWEARCRMRWRKPQYEEQQEEMTVEKIRTVKRAVKKQKKWKKELVHRRWNQDLRELKRWKGKKGKEIVNRRRTV